MCFSLIILISIKLTITIDGISWYQALGTRDIIPIKIYVSIGVTKTKLNHSAATLSQIGKIIIETFKFTDNADGFQ